ncbi:MAG: methyltransferase domain-containing protein [Coriobacteriia bacterium]|nr:methyltransferase domain-containing protein [Coriobacteriia bacterium]
METELTMLDLIIETHIGLERQGPGSTETTKKALSFVDDLGEDALILDLACGTGGQTMIIAQSISGNITGLDILPDFIDVLNENARALGFQENVRGVVGSMDDLDSVFEKESFDLIWSEGAIDGIGFEKGVSYWNSFLKQDGYLAVTCPSWLTDKRPHELEKFWGDAVGGLQSVEENLATLQRSGYRFIAAFVLPNDCWTEYYFAPRSAADTTLTAKYPKNKTVQAYLKDNEYEIELFSKFNQYYGYVFYIGKKT